MNDYFLANISDVDLQVLPRYLHLIDWNKDKMLFKVEPEKTPWIPGYHISRDAALALGFALDWYIVDLRNERLAYSYPVTSSSRVIEKVDALINRPYPFTIIDNSVKYSFSVDR
jgi:hypothetical protein